MSDSPKETEDVLLEQYGSSLLEYRKSRSGLFLSALAGGLEIGFSVVLMGLLYTTFHDKLSEEVLHVLVAMGYPLGFIFVIIGGSQLFTEQTSLAMIPFLKGSVAFKELLKLWSFVLLGNIIGGSLFASFISWIGPAHKVVSAESLVSFAETMIKPEWYIVAGSAVLAGWMMGLLGWLLTSAQETISRIFLVALVTFVIGYGKLHHCVVGTVELVAGLIHSSDPNLGVYLSTLALTVVGNLIGGAVFVAVLRYSIHKL